MYGLRKVSKVKKRPIDFNVTECETFLGIVSGPKLQLNFENTSYVGFLCYITEVQSLEETIKTFLFALAGVAQLAAAPSHELTGCRFDS